MVVWNSEVIAPAARWTRTWDATAARKGSHGLHLVRDATAGSGAGAYLSFSPVETGHRWGTAPNATQLGVTPLIGTSAIEPKKVWVRAYWKPVTMTANISATYYLMELVDSSGAQWAAIRYASPNRLALIMGGVAKGATFTPVAGTWYRLELFMECDTFGNVVAGWRVYAEAGTTPLEQASATNFTSSFPDIRTLNIGYKHLTGGAQGAAAQEGYFADIAVNDDLVATGQTGVHVQSPWGGANRNFLAPNAASISGWTASGGGANYLDVDEFGAGGVAPDDATTYCRTPAAVGTPQDSHGFPNPTIAGSEVVKSMAVITKSDDFAGGFPYYKMGMREAGGNLEVDMNDTAAWFWRCAAVGEVNSGGAWTNAKANGAELQYRKTTSDATAQMDVSSISVEVEDDDEMGAPPALPLKQRRRSAVH